jgi:hypothetical protein
VDEERDDIQVEAIEADLGDVVPAGANEVPRPAWSAWCEATSTDRHGRPLILRYADVALGQVRLAEGESFVSIDHDELGGAVALTIRYGDGVVPRRHVIAEPRHLLAEEDPEGHVTLIVVEDSTRRRTFLELG